MWLWLVNKIFEAWNSRDKVKVLVHEACFESDRRPFYFIKIINVSPKNNFTITHVWIKDNANDKEILNPNTKLPHKLERSEVWETWYPKNDIEDHTGIFENVYVRLSDDKTYKSKKNLNIRPSGSIA